MANAAIFKVGDRRYSTAFRINLVVTEVWEANPGAGDWQVVLSRLPEDGGMSFCRESERTVLSYTTEERKDDRYAHNHPRHGELMLPCFPACQKRTKKVRS